jgi:ABC-type dipeptide/oligopeptide/nickel transport system permease component
MNTTTQTRQERQADNVIIIGLSIVILLIISFFTFILPNITQDNQVEAYIRSQERKEIKQAHEQQMNIEAERVAEYKTK